MTEGELLIRIKTALESGGLDAAKTKLGDLITSTTEATAASGKQKLQLDGLNTGFSRSAAGIKVLSDLSKGSADSMFAAAGGAQALLSSIGGLGAIGGVVAAITALIGIVMQFRQASERAKKDVEDLAASLAEMNSMKLDKVGQQLQSMLDLMTASHTEAESLYNAQKQLQDAYADAEVAKIEASMPEGRAREDAVAKARRQQQIDREAADQRELLRNRARDEKQLQDLQNRRAALAEATKQAVYNRDTLSVDDPRYTRASSAADAARAQEKQMGPQLEIGIADAKRRLEQSTVSERRLAVNRETSALQFQVQQQDVAAKRAAEDADAKAKADERAAKEAAAFRRESAAYESSLLQPVIEKQIKEAQSALKGVGTGKLAQAADKESAEAMAAQRDLEVFDASGIGPDGRRVNRRGSAGKRTRQQLLDTATQEQQEADAAKKALAETKQTLLQTLQQLNAELASVKEQVRNANT